MEARRTWMLASLVGALVALPMLQGAEQARCVPVPQEPECAEAGEYVYPWDPESLECCDGLETSSVFEIDENGVCQPLLGGAVCIARGDGVCGVAEDVCNSPDDCGACIGEGEHVFPWDPNSPGCCAGLVALEIAELDAATGQCVYMDGALICLACGDGICQGPDENFCNCPEDCPSAGGCDGLGEQACLMNDACLAGYRGFCDCTCPGPPGYEGGGCEGCGRDCFVYTACVPGPVALSLSLDTAGGFAGFGRRDYVLSGRALSIVDPWSDVESCTVELHDGQMGRLLTAAGHVDWTSIASSYIDPNNPYCCCDQFVYELHATVRYGDGHSTSRATRWCDEAMFGGTLPRSLRSFYDTLDAIGGEAVQLCTP